MSGPSLRQLVLALIVFGVVGVVVYGSVVHNGYAFDAFYIVRDNPQAQPDASVADVFTSPYWTGDAAAGRALYRPLAILTFQSTRRMLDDPLAVDHALDVVLHVATSLALLTFLMQMGARFGIASTLALLFLVHPVQTEVVASLVGRTDLLATLFALLALNLALARSIPPPLAWVGVFFAFSASLLSKESAVALVAILPACWIAREVWSGSDGRRAALGGFALAAVLGMALIAHLVLRQQVLGDLMVSEAAIQGDESRGFFELRWRALAFATLYVQKIVWPHPLLPDYLSGVVPTEGLGLNLRAMVGTGMILASLVWAGLALVRERTLSRGRVGVLLFWVAMAPVSNLVIQIGTPFGERLVYFPFVFLLLAAVDLPVWRRVDFAGFGLGPRFWPVWLVVFVALALVSALRVPEWKSNRALFEAAVRDCPENYYSQMAYGATLMREGGGPVERESAIGAFRAAASVDETAYPPWSMLGQLSYAEGDYRNARAFFEEANRRAEGIEREPSLLNLTRTYRALRDFDAVQSLIVPEAARHPEWIDLQRELGDYWLSRGRMKQAIRAFERVLQAQPEDRAIWRAVIRAHLALGQTEQASERIADAPPGTIDRRFELQLERDGLELPN